MAKLIKVEQGTPQWDEARRGMITASRFGDVIAKPTTKRYRDYLSELVDERLGLVSNEAEATKPWFEHGKALEPRARAGYEMKTGHDLVNNFMLLHPEHDFIAASPDGAPIDLGGLKLGETATLEIPWLCEIKGRNFLRTYDEAVRVGVSSNYKPQVQGQLWLGECDRLDYVNYYELAPCPEFPNGLRRINILEVEADPEYHSFLEEKCMEFELAIRKELAK